MPFTTNASEAAFANTITQTEETSNAPIVGDETTAPCFRHTCAMNAPIQAALTGTTGECSNPPNKLTHTMSACSYTQKASLPFRASPTRPINEITIVLAMPSRTLVLRAGHDPSGDQMRPFRTWCGWLGDLNEMPKNGQRTNPHKAHLPHAGTGHGHTASGTSSMGELQARTLSGDLSSTAYFNTHPDASQCWTPPGATSVRPLTQGNTSWPSSDPHEMQPWCTGVVDRSVA